LSAIEAKTQRSSAKKHFGLISVIGLLLAVLAGAFPVTASANPTASCGKVWRWHQPNAWPGWGWERADKTAICDSLTEWANTANNRIRFDPPNVYTYEAWPHDGGEPGSTSNLNYCKLLRFKNGSYIDAELYWEIREIDSGVACTEPVQFEASSVKGAFSKKSEDAQICLADGMATSRPIIPATGEKILDEEDYAGDGPHALNLVRHFRSFWLVGPTTTYMVKAGMGPVWSHNHAVKLMMQGAQGTEGSVARVVFGDGRVDFFSWNTGNGSWVPASGISTLVPNAGGFFYKNADDDSLWQFNAAGKLQTMVQRNGWVTTYTYSTAATPSSIAFTAGLLIGVSNQFGRSLSFAYGADGLLQRVTASDGQVISYTYTGTQLTVVTTQGNASGNVSKTYWYENATYSQLVTGITDEKGQRYQTISYDSQGRATTSQLAGGVDLHSVSYGTGTATVTDPLGTQRTFSYATQGQKLVVVGSTLPSDGSTRSAASRVQNSSGLITQETDFLGVNTMYTWDINRRLPLSTTRAAALPEVQTTTTQWHASFRLPVLVTEAGRTTAYTYDTIGNPLTRTVTDTASNVSRTTTWTYNPQGLLATETAPNGVVARTYAYYTDSTDFIDHSTSLDPAFASVSLLLHGDGADGSTVFLDSGPSPKTPAVGGGAQISTVQSQYGGTSMKFDGSSSLLTYPHDATLNLANGDFTIEASVYINSLAFHNVILQKDQSFGTTFTSYAFYVSTSGQLQGGVGTGDGAGYSQWLTSEPGLITPGQFYHVAFTRQGSVLRLFVNGALVQTATQAGTPADGGKPLVIGRYPAGGGTADNWFNGYIDELRITKGVARYSANFTPPTQAFPNGPAIIPGHTSGDLQSITNAAGHVTRFTLYDRAGRVRQMVDPKGVVTDVVYTPRGLTSSVTVTPPDDTAITTSYTYDNAGQLTGATLPDGTTLGYSYDAAHRLTGVTDAKGNTVTYTLDGMGNKTSEKVKDSSGTLQRNITRVYDALNRIQQVTGASN